MNLRFLRSFEMLQLQEIERLMRGAEDLRRKPDQHYEKIARDLQRYWVGPGGLFAPRHIGKPFFGYRQPASARSRGGFLDGFLYLLAGAHFDDWRRQSHQSGETPPKLLANDHRD